MNIDLYVNNNAERDATYIGNQTTTEGANAFVVQPIELQTDALSEMNGLPTFQANIVGVTDTNAYYLVDFTSS